LATDVSDRCLNLERALLAMSKDFFSNQIVNFMEQQNEYFSHRSFENNTSHVDLPAKIKEFIDTKALDFKSYRMSFTHTYPVPSYSLYMMIGVLKFFGNAMHIFDHDNYCLDFLPPGKLGDKSIGSSQLYAVNSIGKTDYPLDSRVNEAKFNNLLVANYLSKKKILVRYNVKMRNFDNPDIVKKYDDVYVEDVAAQQRYVMDHHPYYYPDYDHFIYLIPYGGVKEFIGLLNPKKKYTISYIDGPPGVFSSIGMFIQPGNSTYNGARLLHIVNRLGFRVSYQFVPQVAFMTNIFDKYNIQFVNLSKHFDQTNYIERVVVAGYYARNKKLDYMTLLTKGADVDKKDKAATMGQRHDASLQYSNFQDKNNPVDMPEIDYGAIAGYVPTKVKFSYDVPGSSNMN